MHPDSQIRRRPKAAALALSDDTATPCFAISKGDLADRQPQTRCGDVALLILRRNAVAKSVDNARRIDDLNREVHLADAGRPSSPPATGFKGAASQPDLRQHFV